MKAKPKACALIELPLSRNCIQPFQGFLSCYHADDACAVTGIFTSFFFCYYFSSWLLNSSPAGTILKEPLFFPPAFSGSRWIFEPQDGTPKYCVIFFTLGFWGTSPPSSQINHTWRLILAYECPAWLVSYQLFLI